METKNVGHVAKGGKILDAPPRGCEEFMMRHRGGGKDFGRLSGPRGSTYSAPMGF